MNTAVIDGVEVSRLGAKALTEIRREKIGLVFQQWRGVVLEYGRLPASNFTN